jgi:hypothetical protein
MEIVMSECWMYGDLAEDGVQTKSKPRQLETYEFSNSSYLTPSGYSFPVQAVNAIPGVHITEKKETCEEEKQRLILEHIEDSKKWLKRFNDSEESWGKEFRRMDRVLSFFVFVAAFELMFIVWLMIAFVR